MSECVNNISIDRSRPLCFFGLGATFHDCYRQLVLTLGKPPDILCDNDSSKWGKMFRGCRCVSPEELVLKGREAFVVITVRRFEGIYAQLQALGLTDIHVACFDRAYDVISGVRRIGSVAWEPDSSDGLMPVRGKWTLVTGASRGIGRQIAVAMAGQGSNIIAHGRTEEHLVNVLGACRAMGVEALPVAAELGDLLAVERMLDRLEQLVPRIDVLFNNAAIAGICGASAWDVRPRDYLSAFTVNAVVPIRICSRLVPAMIEHGFGRVVNISSTLQRVPGSMDYTCSKAAVNKYVHDLAPSLQGTGVVISLVCPGHVRSDMGGATAPAPVESVIPGAILGAVMERVANGRWFSAQDYAGLSLPAAVQRDRFYRGVADGADA